MKKRTWLVTLIIWTFFPAVIAMLLTPVLSCAESSPTAMLNLQQESAIVQVETIHGGENPAAGYIQKKMYPAKPGILRASRISGYSLEGANRYLYLQLRIKVAAIAAGEISKAVFSFPVEDVFDKTEFTDSELGVEDILILDENGKVTVTPEAKAAVSAVIKNRIDQLSIIRCLMADCPYELYWYDKTVGIVVDYPSGKYYDYKVVLEGNVTFSMAVSEEYRAAGEDPIRFVIGGKEEYHYCHVGTQWGQSVITAVRNAQEIVNRYEGLDDYERLVSYKDAIRNMAEYNRPAANGQVPFGNPWQLIWVFDGDPETKVVCEGYSKAFQYLNDLSTGSQVTVICATGTMDGGLHMWNIVRMDDGQNYLADITNCYRDENGREILFLEGYKEALQDRTFVYDGGHDDENTYEYNSENDIFEANDLNVSETGYLEAKPPAPIFQARESPDTFLIGTELGFTLDDSQQTNYDSFLFRVTGIPADPEASEKVVRGTFDGLEWTFGPEFHEAGTYYVQFAGRCGLYTSLWSEPIVLTPVVTEDLGWIGFTDGTKNDLLDISAGDTGSLVWCGAQNGIKGYVIRMVEDIADGEVWIDQSLAADRTETEIIWAFCPGDYLISFIPDVAAGYAYSSDDPVKVTVKYSEKQWLISDEGVLTKYFGSGVNVTVPEAVGSVEVQCIGQSAFERSRARKVTVPSFVGANVLAFSGITQISTVYGYTGSEAETAAEAAGISFVSLGVKPPEARIADVSSEQGYTGFSFAIRLQERADAVMIKETKALIPCAGTDVLIPLDTTGICQYTVALVVDGVRGDYGDSATILVEESGNQTLTIPENTKTIDNEAFRGIKAPVVQIPDSVQSIGTYAFADNHGLKIVQISDLRKIGNTVFSNCSGFVWCFADAAYGFSTGEPFLIK